MTLATELAQNLSAHADTFIWDLPTDDVQAAVDRDEVLLKDLANRSHGGCLVRLWSCSRALVVPRHLSRRPLFATARQHCNLTLAIRSSGGTVVLHGPEFINLTVMTAHRTDHGIDVDRLYSAFGAILFPSLARMGITAGFEEVCQAYCSGRHDVAVAGRKLAGTAAIVRRIGGVQAQLVHAVLRLSPVDGEIAMISAFEQAMGLNPSYDPAFLTSLAQERLAVSVA